MKEIVFLILMLSTHPVLADSVHIDITATVISVATLPDGSTVSTPPVQIDNGIWSY